MDFPKLKREVGISEPINIPLIIGIILCSLLGLGVHLFYKAKSPHAFYPSIESSIGNVIVNSQYAMHTAPSEISTYASQNVDVGCVVKLSDDSVVICRAKESSDDTTWDHEHNMRVSHGTTILEKDNADPDYRINLNPVLSRSCGLGASVQTVYGMSAWISFDVFPGIIPRGLDDFGCRVNFALPFVNTPTCIVIPNAEYPKSLYPSLSYSVTKTSITMYIKPGYHYFVMCQAK